jgi:hypothetical protein
LKPDWKNLDLAFSLLSDGEADDGPFYGLYRAISLIKLDPDFAAGKASSPATKKAILQDLRNARRGLGADLEGIIEHNVGAAVAAAEWASRASTDPCWGQASGAVIYVIKRRTSPAMT